MHHIQPRANYTEEWKRLLLEGKNGMIIDRIKPVSDTEIEVIYKLITQAEPERWNPYRHVIDITADPDHPSFGAENFIEYVDSVITAHKKDGEKLISAMIDPADKIDEEIKLDNSVYFQNKDGLQHRIYDTAKEEFIPNNQD